MLSKRILVLMFVVLFLTLVGCLPTVTPPVTENQAPVITSDSVTTAIVGVAYTYDVEATDPDGDTLTYSLSVKPTGMTINSATGVIKWTPYSTQVGGNPVTVEVSDGTLSDTQSFTIVVSGEEEEFIGGGYVPTPTPTKTYTITVTVGLGGSISPSGDVTVNEGSDKSFTITPDTVFYGIANVLVDNNSVGVVSNYNFTDVTEDHTISATFVSLGCVYNEDDGTHFNTIQDAVEDDGNHGDTLLVALGTYNITSTLLFDGPNLTLKGEVGSKPKITTSGSNYIFNISALGVTIENFEIEKTDKLIQNIIYVGADDVTIKDNLIHGQYVMGDDPTGVAPTRAMEVAGGLTGLQIEGNTIYSLRQPAYINPATGAISNNDVYNTRGWVIVSQSDLTFTDNTWGDGTLPNYYDIAIIKDAPEGANNYPDIVTMSEENNNAIIENQHSTYANPILSIVHVDASTSGSENGSILEPYATISPNAIPRVALGGTVHVAVGTYPENVTIGKIGVILQASTKHEAVIEGTVTIIADNVTVDGFSIKNFSNPADWPGIYMPSGTGILVVNNLIDGIDIDPVANLTVGIHTKYGGTAEATLEGNIIKNVRMGIYSQGASLLITNNIIENTSHCGIGIDTSLGTIITGNTINNTGTYCSVWTTLGIEVFGANVVANFNNITGNADFGVWSDGAQVDATNNWWGSGGTGADAGKPGEDGNNGVSPTVVYIPWLTSQH